jgi:hypothetical protein
VAIPKVANDTLEILQPIDAPMTSLSFSPDGKRIAAGNPHSPSVRLWNVVRGRLEQSATVRQEAGDAIAFSADGRTVAAKHEASITSTDVLAQKPLGELVALPRAGSEGEDWQRAKDTYLLTTRAGYFHSVGNGHTMLRYELGSRSFPAECFAGIYQRPDAIPQVLAGAPPSPPRLRGPFPPRVYFTSPTTAFHTSAGSLSAVVEAEDDRRVTRVEFRVNGKPLPPPLVVRSDARLLLAANPPNPKPIRAGSKPIRVGSKPIRVGSKPIRVGSKPIRIGSKAVQADGDPYQATQVFSAEIPLPVSTEPIRVTAIAYEDDGLRSAEQEIQVVRSGTAPPPAAWWGCAWASAATRTLASGSASPRTTRAPWRRSWDDRGPGSRAFTAAPR